MTKRLLSQGAEVGPYGVRYRLWAPEHSDVAVEIYDGAERPLRRVPLSRVSLGYHQALDAEGRPGDLYKFRLGSAGVFPCPASRWQPLGTNGPSMVVDPTKYVWNATHQIFDDSSRHILEELAEAVHARGGYVIAEDERNEARIVDAKKENGYALDALWADDFHHSIEVAAIGESTYASDFTGAPHELADLLHHGWLYRGQEYKKLNKARGTQCDHLPPERFVYCISNHDQVGNRAFGERLHQMVSIETWRAASALLCLGPGIPLLFMGQEWATTAPFLYFTDHVPELGRLVEEGRRREFEWVFRNAERRGITIPSPQAPETFESSKLPWDEITREPHPGCLALYRELLALRRTYRVFRPTARDGVRAASLSGDILALRLSDAESEWLIFCDLHGGYHGSLRTEKFCQLPEGRRWRAILNSNEPRFGGLAGHSYDEPTGSVTFTLPEVLLLQAT